MPTINEVIERVGRTKPNAMEDRDKAGILINLDSRIYHDLTMADAQDQIPPEQWPEDGDKQLLVTSPFDNIYDLYLTAMIEFHMREYGNFNNTVMLFNEAMNDYKAKYRRDHRPARKYLHNVL